MKEKRVYKLEKNTWQEILPKMVEKLWKSGNRILIEVADDAQIAEIDKLLWTYSREEFLPHDFNNPLANPIFIANSNVNSNQASVVISLKRMNEDFNLNIFIVRNDFSEHLSSDIRIFSQQKDGSWLKI